MNIIRHFSQKLPLDPLDRFAALEADGYAPLVLPHQAHSDVVISLPTHDTRPPLADFIAQQPHGDALVTNQPGLFIGVKTADCVPILMWDAPERRGSCGVRAALEGKDFAPRGERPRGVAPLESPLGASSTPPTPHACVSATHAGWRGTASEIVRRTVEVMVRDYGANPAKLRAAIGPCVHMCCYETNGDVPAAFNPEIRRIGESDGFIRVLPNGKFRIDLAEINRLLLLRAGLLPEHITIDPTCTACNPDVYWSHRVHGGERGTQVSLIGICPVTCHDDMSC